MEFYNFVFTAYKILVKNHIIKEAGQKIIMKITKNY